MGFVSKYKREIIFSLLLIALYLFLRLPTLLQLPIFTDEAIYVRWAQIAKDDANWRFISLTDGKQPLFIWAAIVSMKFFADPLLASRMVSVGAGLLTMVGLFLLGREVFKNHWVGLLTALLYAIYPFSLIYDRMALYDSLVGTLAVWGLYLTILLVRRQRVDLAMTLGFVTGAAVLNKTNGFFTIYLLPIALLLFDWPRKGRRERLVRFALLGLIVTVMTYGIYSILRLSPYFYIIEEKNALFVYPLSEWIKHPLVQIPSNMSGLLNWFLLYFGVPGLVAAIGSFIVSKTFLREKVLLVLWFVLPFIALVVFGKTLYPRYILFMTLSLLPLFAYFLVSLHRKVKGLGYYLIVSLFVLSFVFVDLKILTDFTQAPIPQSDKAQYLTAWPSGVGISEATAILKKESVNKKIYVGTQGTFGLLPYALEISFHRNPNVTIKGYWPIPSQIPRELLDLAKKQDTYVIFYQSCQTCVGNGLPPIEWPLREVFKKERIEQGTFFSMYQVLSQ